MGMSFSAELKTEILENRVFRSRLKKAHAYGLFVFSKSFSSSSVSIATESAGTAELYTWFLRNYLGGEIMITKEEKRQNGKTVHTVKLDEPSCRARLLKAFGYDEKSLNTDIITTPAHASAFIAGAYLACGSLTDPQKSYHMEFVTQSEGLCEELMFLLERYIPGVKQTKRRSKYVLYYKEYAQIEDLLTFIGAPKSCLSMIDVEMIKSVRNDANRATNCETANIDKTVEASANRTRDIRLVLDTVGREALPEELLSVALLRLENPEASLRELGELAEPKMSRSGIFHRLRKLSEMAGKIREDGGGKA